MTHDIALFLVGGYVRDLMRGVESNDIDFAVQAPSYSAMREWVVENGFEIYEESEKYVTIRAGAHSSFEFAGKDMSRKPVDFTLCRVERDYTDGRHPDVIEAGTIYDDLARRDFTMNAIAIDANGRIIDPYDGYLDIQRSLIRCVGGVERLEEDGLRIMRAIRFACQLDFFLDTSISRFFWTTRADDALDKISDDRIRKELEKAIRADIRKSMWYLNEFTDLADVIFEKGIWLLPTTKMK